MALPALIKAPFSRLAARSAASGSSSRARATRKAVDGIPAPFFRTWTPGDLSLGLPSGLGQAYSGSVYAAVLLARDPVQQSTIIAAALRWIATIISDVRWEVANSATDKVVDGHPAAMAMAGGIRSATDKDTWTRSELVWAIVEALLIAGNAVVYPQPNGVLRPLDWRNVTLPRPGVKARQYIVYDRMAGMTVRLPEEGVAHLRYRRSPDGWNGLGLVGAAALSELETDREGQAYTLTMLHRMGVPGVMFFPDDEKDDFNTDDTDAIKTAGDQLYTGENRGAWAAFTKRWKTFEPSGPATKVDLGPIRNISEERLFAQFGLHPALVGVGTGAQQTRVGATMNIVRRNAIEQVVMPFCDHIAQQLTAHLLPFYENRPGMEFRADYTHSLAVQARESEVLTEQAAGLLPFLQAGVLTADEVREQLGWEGKAPGLPEPALPNPNGDAAPR